MDEVDLYIEEQRKIARNRLLIHKESIEKMRNAGLSFKAIALFFNRKGIAISQQAISQFYKRQIENKEHADLKKVKIQKSVESTTKDDEDDPIIKAPAWATQNLRRSDLF